MITYMILVLTVTSASAKSFKILETNVIPPYIESKNAFTLARLFIENNLPQDLNVTKPKDQRYYAFAAIVKVTRELASAVCPTDPPQRYDAIKVLQDSIPITPEEYNEIKNATKLKISEALSKIDPIRKMIKKKCHLTANTECNKKVAMTIEASNNDIKKRANLLLLLGKASDHINSYSNLINVLIADNKEIEYLKHHIQDPYVKRVMKDFTAVNSFLSTIK